MQIAVEFRTLRKALNSSSKIFSTHAAWSCSHNYFPVIEIVTGIELNLVLV
jgi:hypothetical protein